METVVGEPPERSEGGSPTTVLTLIRCNPVFKAFRKRLQQAGKPYKLIAVACIRKLLGILNSMIKSNSSWNSQHVA